MNKLIKCKDNALLNKIIHSLYICKPQYSINLIFSSPDPKGHVSYCHHLASVVVVVVHRELFSSPGPKVQVNYCHHLASVVCCLSSVVCKLFTFQASSPKPLGQLEPNLAGMFLGWSSTKLLFFVPVGYPTWLPGPIICSDWLKFQRSSSLKLMN